MLQDKTALGSIVTSSETNIRQRNMEERSVILKKSKLVSSNRLRSGSY